MPGPTCLVRMHLFLDCKALSLKQLWDLPGWRMHLLEARLPYRSANFLYSSAKQK